MNHALTIGDAIAVATRWIITSTLPFGSAFIGGSAAGADLRLPLVATSDIDCYLVTTGDPPDGKIGKITVDGVLLDVSWLSWDQLAHVESNAVLASLLRFGQVVLDRDDALTRLQQGLITHFADSRMIERRLEDIRTRILTGLEADSSHLPQPEQVMNWLFPATLATHLPLVAACRPLTVRKRFLAARNIMSGQAYESLLRLYGFSNISAAQVQQWLNDTATLFHSTAPIAAGSGRFWASDLHADMHAIAIGGSQQLIDAGDHREALYWIIATQARCLTVLNDAGIDTSPFLPAFDECTYAVEIATTAERAVRSRAIIAWTQAFTDRY